MNRRLKTAQVYHLLPLKAQIELSSRATMHILRRHPHRLALPGTLAGGILTFAILIPFALR